MRNPLGEEAKEAKSAIGTGTKVSGYIESPVSKRCGTCEYLVGKNLCRQARVKRDPLVKTDKRTQLKIVDPKDGCCSFWEANDED